MVNAHLDSPVLKIKPASKHCKLGYVQVCAAPGVVVAAAVPLSRRRVSGLVRPIWMCNAFCRACHSPRRCGCPPPYFAAAGPARFSRSPPTVEVEKFGGRL